MLSFLVGNKIASKGGNTYAEQGSKRYLYNAGLGVKQMKRYTEKRETSSRRFCRPHRMELLQGDIKYGPDIRLSDGTLIKTYLSSLIDDHSRFIVQSEFYDNQRQEVVEDTFHNRRHTAKDIIVQEQGRENIHLQFTERYKCFHVGKYVLSV